MTKPKRPAAPPRIAKSQQLLTLLQTGTGASLEDMTEATGWLPHTVRAAMTGLRKKGHIVEKHVEGILLLMFAKPESMFCANSVVASEIWLVSVSSRIRSPGVIRFRKITARV